MFLTLTESLVAAGFPAASLFDLHPDQFLALAEAAWDALCRRRNLPWSGKKPASLTGYGAVQTAAGTILDDEAVGRVAATALAHPGATPTTAFAWLVEGSGLVELLGVLAHSEINGLTSHLRSPGSLRWLQATELLFAGDNLLTLRSPLRPAPHIARANLYRRTFGAPAASGVFLDGVDGSFTTLLSAGLSGNGKALAALAAFAESPTGLAREAFAAAELVSWFYLTLQLPDSPVVADLGLADRDFAGRLAGLTEILGRGTDEVAPRLLEAAPLLDGLLRALAEGRAPDLARLAALWPSLEVPPAESEEDGAGGSLGLAFGGAIDLGASGGFMFADILQPDVFKITDQDARVRSGPPTFGMTTSKLAYGTSVQISGVALQDGTYFAQVTPLAGGDGAWTKLSNLTVVPNALVGRLEPSDNAETGPFAMWDDGKFIGQTPLWIMGGQSKLLLVKEETLQAYREMLTEARAAGLELVVKSGFRSYPEQKYFWDLWQAHKGNEAAKPGRSNHQSGEALDIEMQMGKGNPGSNVASWTTTYRWMVKNARRFGFMRTVPTEAWHWEYRPGKAENDDTFGNWTHLKSAGLA